MREVPSESRKTLCLVCLEFVKPWKVYARGDALLFCPSCGTLSPEENFDEFWEVLDFEEVSDEVGSGISL